MSNYGVTIVGFIPKPVSVCYEEVKAAIRATFGQTANVADPAGPWGQLAGILADREAELWDALGSVYGSRDPDQATGAALEAIAALTGCFRKPALKSTAYCTLIGTPNAFVPVGSVVSSMDGSLRFASAHDATLSGAGTAFNVLFENEDPGPIALAAGTLSVIATPVAGWTAIQQPIEATPGAWMESDASLRIRRLEELALPGSATVDAIRAQILLIEDVQSATVFENTDIVTDAAGVPPKAFEAVVTGGLDQEIIDAIWKSRPAGIQSWGTKQGTILDSQGYARTVRFSRPSRTPIYTVLTVTTDALGVFPPDGIDQIKAQLAAWGAANLFCGQSVVVYQMEKAIIVPGIIDIPAFYIGKGPSPTSGATQVMSARQQAVIADVNVDGSWDVSRILVNGV